MRGSADHTKGKKVPGRPSLFYTLQPSFKIMADPIQESTKDGELISKSNTAVQLEATPAQPRHALREYERLFKLDEEAYEQPTTTKKELWSYYLYYNGKLVLKPHIRV